MSLFRGEIGHYGEKLGKWQDHSKRGTLSTPPRTNRDSIFGRGQPSREISAPARNFFSDPPETATRPARKRKKHCFCILEGRLTTNPILSALHLQGSQIQYICALPPSN